MLFPTTTVLMSHGQTIFFLHKRLGHPSVLVLKTLFLTLKIPHPLPSCEVCEYAKHKKSIYPSSLTRKSYPFQLIHSDVWGPLQEVSIHDHRWFISVPDSHGYSLWKLNQKYHKLYYILVILSNNNLTQKSKDLGLIMQEILIIMC